MSEPGVSSVALPVSENGVSAGMVKPLGTETTGMGLPVVMVVPQVPPLPVVTWAVISSSEMPWKYASLLL